jgi:hypothetical protein
MPTMILGMRNLLCPDRAVEWGYFDAGIREAAGQKAVTSLRSKTAERVAPRKFRTMELCARCVRCDRVAR